MIFRFCEAVALDTSGIETIIKIKRSTLVSQQCDIIMPKLKV